MRDVGTRLWVDTRRGHGWLVVGEATVSPTILRSCTHINRRFSTRVRIFLDIKALSANYGQFVDTKAHHSCSCWDQLTHSLNIHRMTTPAGFCTDKYLSILRLYMARIDWQKIQKSFALCLDGFISSDMWVASRLNFRSQKWSVDFGLLHLGNLLAQQVAAMPNDISIQVEMAWTVHFGSYWKRLWVDMIGSRFIWLVGRRLKDNQDYLRGGGKVDFPPRSQWLCCNSKISGGDYRLLRRIQQLSHSRTDFIKSAVSLLSHSLPYVTCHPCDMWHVIKRPVFVAPLFRLCLFPGFRVATVYWQNSIYHLCFYKIRQCQFAFAFRKKYACVISCNSYPWR